MATPQRTVKKLSVLLPANLHRRAKRHALLSDQSLTDLIITLLSNHLDSADREEAL
jgi:predicted HicB family RNase H-like nuclease